MCVQKGGDLWRRLLKENIQVVSSGGPAQDVCSSLRRLKVPRTQESEPRPGRSAPLSNAGTGRPHHHRTLRGGAGRRGVLLRKF